MLFLGESLNYIGNLTLVGMEKQIFVLIRVLPKFWYNDPLE